LGRRQQQGNYCAGAEVSGVNGHYPPLTAVGRLFLLCDRNGYASMVPTKEGRQLCALILVI
jgi:hypothetical protein